MVPIPQEITLLENKRLWGFIIVTNQNKEAKIQIVYGQIGIHWLFEHLR